MSESELTDIRIHIATHSTAQCTFLAIRFVVPLHWTLRRNALRQFSFLLARQIVPLILFFVAILAEMCVSSAEPLTDWAAKLALVLNELHAMHIAIRASCHVLHVFCCTLRTYKFFFIKVIHVHVALIFTFLFPSEIRHSAFKAFVISESCQCIFFRFSVIIFVIWIVQSLIF